MHGVGLDADVRMWFAEPAPRPGRSNARAARAPRLPPPRVPPDLVRKALRAQ